MKQQFMFVQPAQQELATDVMLQCLLGPDRYGIFGADANKREQENSDIQYTA